MASPIRKALITGGRGFIGRYLTERLIRSGVEVVRVDKKMEVERSSSCLQDVLMNILDAQKAPESLEFMVSGCDVVFHLAAQSDVNSSVLNPLDDASNNVLGTLAILDACKVEQVPIVYAASGGTIYGRRPDDPTAPSPYALSKKVGEEYCRLYSELFSMSYISLRLGNVFGYGGKGVIERWLYTIMRGEVPFITGDGRQTRDYVYVEDVADAFVKAGEALVEDGPHSWATAMDIGSGKSISVVDLANVFQDATGYDMSQATSKPLPAGEVELMELNESNLLMARNIGWSPRTTLEAGIKKTMEMVKSNEKK